MSFQKYPSLTNHYQVTAITYLRQHITEDSWLVFEKIHGANFSFQDTDGTGIKCAKRTDFVHEGEKFYGHRAVAVKYQDKAQQLLDSIGGGCIYGELYGKGVQPEVKYGDKDFRAYDICDKEGNFISPMEVQELCNTFEIPVIPPLFTGTLDECLQYSPDRTSDFSNEGEPSEGVVLKPLHVVRSPSGSLPYIKHKSKAFSEKKDRTPSKVKKEKVHHPFFDYVTPARASAVLSKHGFESMQELPTLANLFLEDVIEDLGKEGLQVDKAVRKLLITECFKVMHLRLKVQVHE